MIGWTGFTGIRRSRILNAQQDSHGDPLMLSADRTTNPAAAIDT
jgi:hypothetical protein